MSFKMSSNSSRAHSASQSQKNSRQASPTIPVCPQKRYLVTISKTKLFRRTENFLDYLLTFRTKKFLTRCAFILAIITIYVIGCLDRYCDENCSKNCKPCPKNAICQRYTFICTNGTIKGYDHCFETLEEKMNEKPNLILLIALVAVFSCWIILILFCFSLK